MSAKENINDIIAKRNKLQEFIKLNDRLTAESPNHTVDMTQYTTTQKLIKILNNKIMILKSLNPSDKDTSVAKSEPTIEAEAIKPIERPGKANAIRNILAIQIKNKTYIDNSINKLIETQTNVVNILNKLINVQPNQKIKSELIEKVKQTTENYLQIKNNIEISLNKFIELQKQVISSIESNKDIKTQKNISESCIKQFNELKEFIIKCTSESREVFQALNLRLNKIIQQELVRQTNVKRAAGKQEPVSQEAIKPTIEKDAILVVMPTYNRSDYIENSIAMINAQIYNNWVFLIIDDGSTEIHKHKFREIKEKYQSNKILFQENDVNCHIAITLNKGIRYLLDSCTNFTHFTWISDDNKYFSNFLAELYKENTFFKYGSYNVQELNGDINTNNKSYQDFNNILQNFAGCASFMWTKEAINKIGFYDESVPCCEDFEYLLRTFKLNAAVCKYTHIPTMKCIIHVNSLIEQNRNTILSLQKQIITIYAHMDEIKLYFIYYSKTQYHLLFQRPQQIMRFFSNEYNKCFIGLVDDVQYEEKYNLLIVPYCLKTIVFNAIHSNTNNQMSIYYYTDTRLYDEINTLNGQKLFDLIDAPIDECNVWKPNLANCVKNANFVFYSHPELIRFLNEINSNKRYHYISNGCDYEHFSKANQRIGERPHNFPQTDKEILGYFGSFTKWLDHNLIKQYADGGRFHIVMIGGIVDNTNYNIKFDHPDITWLEHTHYDNLPYYLSWFDVCFLPFKEYDLLKYANPCKLWEFMASEKEIIKANVNIDSAEIVKYTDVCVNIKKILTSFVDVISLFYNNESIIDKFATNFEMFKKIDICSFTFHLIDNNSIDNTFEKLNNIKMQFPNININVYKNPVNGCSSGRNIGLKHVDFSISNYILFLDSDHIIIDKNCVTNLINNITYKIGYIGYYGGFINDAETVSGTPFNDNDTVLINQNTNNAYIGCGCSLLKSSIIFENNLKFDIYYDPFLIEDVDFSFTVNKYTNVLKLAQNNTIIHNKNSTTSTFDKKLTQNMLIRNSHYFIFKFTDVNKNLWNQDYINTPNYNLLQKSASDKSSLYSYQNLGFTFMEIVDQCLTQINRDKETILTVSLAIYPITGGGQNWLMDCCNMLSNYNHLCLCFRDNFTNTYFKTTNLIKHKNVLIIQTPLNLTTIFYLHHKFNFKCINHEGHLRYEIARISNILNLKMISCFCFWNGLITAHDKDDTEMLNINMIDRKFKIDSNFVQNWPTVSFFSPSKFVNDICEKNCGVQLEIIENISKLDCDKIIPNTGIYVSLFNCHQLKGGIELLYILEKLDINIPILAVITEKYKNFDKQISSAFNKRNNIKNINILFHDKQLDVENLYNQSKIILLPSLVDETYCKVCYEAIILNKRIIAYNNGNLKYLLKNYNNCVVIENPLDNTVKKVDDIIIPVFTLNKWKEEIERMYYNDNIEFINYNKISLDVNFVTYQLNTLISAPLFTIERTRIGIYGPYCDQGLGIQMREYYLLLTKLGYDVIVYSHVPYIANCVCKEEWEGMNVFYSKYSRDKLQLDEITEFVSAFNVKTIIMPEICYEFIDRTIKWFKMCNVNIITPINIETLRCDEGSYYHNIDTIVSNNYFSHLILKNVFGEKVKLLDFNNVYFEKSISLYDTNKRKFVFACFGGLNSFFRKNIDKIYNLFSELECTDTNNFTLNIYIQGNIINDSNIVNTMHNTSNINIIICNKSYKDVINCIKESDIIIHFGDHEGLGLGFYEALNNNKPIVTLNTFPNNQFIMHKVNGYLVNCSFTDLSDNNKGISRKAVLCQNDFKDVMQYILDNNNRDEVIRLINIKKHIENNYETNMKQIVG